MSGAMDYSPLGGIWEILELLGQGSYGKVYRAKRNELGEEYYAAIKHISVPQDSFYTDSLYENALVTDEASVTSFYSNMLQSLMVEIKTSYRLKGYTNIVGYEDHYVFPKSDGPGYELFIRMELLKSLHARMKESPFTERDIVKLGVDICMALEVLERENILHRDIKPSNIFVNSAGEYKLGDFGVARILDRSATGVSIRGTFEYMAPELQRGTNINHSADIYSLGLVLYHLCNGGRGPFLKPPPAQVDYAESEKATEKRLKGEALPAPANASIALSKVILTATQFYPDNRYKNATDMKNALLPLLNTNASAAAEDGGRTISIYDGVNTYPRSGPTPAGAGQVPPFTPPPFSQSGATNTPPYSQNPYPPQAPPYTASQYQSTGIPYQYAPPQQASFGPNGYAYPGGNPPPMAAPVRKSGGNLPIILILSAILVGVAVGVYLLFSRDNSKSSRPDTKADASIGQPTGDSPEDNPSTYFALSEPTTEQSLATSNSAAMSAPSPAIRSSIFILEGSDVRYLSNSDVAGLTGEQMMLARYEIFGRHNCRFDDYWVQSYFDACSWYNGYIYPKDFSEYLLNDYEISNLQLLIKQQAALTGYILPESSNRYLTAVDLIGLDDTYSALARNEIFARHGRMFTVDWVRAYFESCPWYYGQIDSSYFDAHMSNYFNLYESQNVVFIQEYEQQHGY